MLVCRRFYGSGGGIDLGVDDRLRPVDARGDDALPYFRRQLLSLGGEGTTEICLPCDADPCVDKICRSMCGKNQVLIPTHNVTF